MAELPSAPTRRNHKALLTTRSELPAVFRIHTGDPAPAQFSRQYTVLADSNHGDIDILKTFRDAFRNFIKDGGTDVVFEDDEAEHSRIFRKVRSGQAQLSDFYHDLKQVPLEKRAEGSAIIQDIMQIALDNENRITFHTLDETPAAAVEYPDVRDALDHAVANGDKGFEEFNNRVKRDPQFAQRFDKYYESFDAQRRQMDLKVSRAIKAMGPKAKVLIFCGAGHDPDLVGHLGADNTQSIYVAKAGSRADQRYARANIPLIKLPIHTAPVPQSISTPGSSELTPAHSAAAERSAKQRGWTATVKPAAALGSSSPKKCELRQGPC